MSESIDPVALLHLRNLKKLVVKKNIPGDAPSTLMFTRHVEPTSLDLSHVKEIFSEELVSAGANVVKISRAEDGTEISSCRFLQIECNFSVPPSMSFSSSSTRKGLKTVPIVLSFPLDSVSKIRGVEENEETESLPVCAFLPIRDLGFRFGLHSNWEVVTSRDEVTDSRWNRHLRDCATRLLLACFKLPQIEDRSLSTFMPRHFVGMNSFWTHFVDVVQAEAVSRLHEGLRQTAGPEFLEHLNLSERQLLEFAKISLIDEKALHHVRHNIPKLSVVDVLECLREGWKIENEKWTTLWQMINEAISEDSDLVPVISEKLLKSPVFFWKTVGDTQHERGDRRALADCVTRVFVSQKKTDTVWRENWAILEYSSKVERATLEKLFPPFTPSLAIEQIFSLHLDCSFAKDLQQLGSLLEVEGDLRFCLQHKDEALRHHKKVNENVPVLFVPVKRVFDGEEKTDFARIEECQLPKLFGVEISSVDKNVISFSTSSLEEEIRLESFALSVGCSVPSSSMVAKSDVTFTLDDLRDFKSDLENILGHVRDSGIKRHVISRIRVAVSGKALPCSTVYACPELEGLMPTVSIPNQLREIAQEFGIKFEISVQTRLDALRA